ncbi:MAG: hypothetical protein R3F10_01400 [Lysobacteraceae bacterium]
MTHLVVGNGIGQEMQGVLQSRRLLFEGAFEGGDARIQREGHASFGSNSARVPAGTLGS